MKPIELYDILTLEEDNADKTGKIDKDYTVANMATYNDATYLYLMEIDKDENIVETNQKIVRRVIKDGDDSVEVVTDQEELAAVSKIFFDLFKNMVDETTSEN